MKCSKCGFENPENAKYCLNCGSKLEVSDNTLSEEKTNKENAFNEKREKIAHTFNRVFSIIAIVIFSVSLFLCLFKYLNISSDFEGVNTSFTIGSAPDYLVSNWLKFNEAGSYEKARIILGFAFVVNNIILTYVFGLKGLISAIKSTVKKDKFNAYKYLAIVLTSNIVTIALLKSISPDVYLGSTKYEVYDTYSTYSTYFWVSTLTLVTMLSTEAFLEFDSKKKCLFIKRIVFSVGIGCALILVSHFGNSIYKFTFGEYTYHFSPLALFLNELNEFLESANGASNQMAINFIFASGLFLFFFIESFLVATLSVYMINGYFSPRFNNKSFVIPAFVVGFAIAILSLVIMVLTIALYFGLGETSNGYDLTSFIEVNTILSLFLLGSVMSSLYILKGYIRSQKQ